MSFAYLEHRCHSSFGLWTSAHPQILCELLFFSKLSTKIEVFRNFYRNLTLPHYYFILQKYQSAIDLTLKQQQRKPCPSQSHRSNVL